MKLDLPNFTILVRYSEQVDVVTPKAELTPTPCHSLADERSWGEILATLNTMAQLHQVELPMLQFVPIDPRPVAGHH